MNALTSAARCCQYTSTDIWFFFLEVEILCRNAACIRLTSFSSPELPARSNSAVMHSKTFCKCCYGIFGAGRLDFVSGAEGVMIRRARLVPLVVREMLRSTKSVRSTFRKLVMRAMAEVECCGIAIAPGSPLNVVDLAIQKLRYCSKGINSHGYYIQLYS